MNKLLRTWVIFLSININEILIYIFNLNQDYIDIFVIKFSIQNPKTPNYKIFV